MYRKILVPLDGSHRAEAIMPHVEELACHFGSRVILLQVVDPIYSMGLTYEMLPQFNEEEIKRQADEARMYLAGWQGELREKGIDARSAVEYGSVPVNSILNVAQREEVDLIAMASHGRSGLSRVFYGSIAAGILSQADRPLLLVRSQEY